MGRTDYIRYQIPSTVIAFQQAAVEIGPTPALGCEGAIRDQIEQIHSRPANIFHNEGDKQVY